MGGGLAYNFRVSVHYGGEHGSMLAGTGAVAESYILIYRQREREERERLAFETSKPTTYNKLLSTRPYLLIILILK